MRTAGGEAPAPLDRRRGRGREGAAWNPEAPTQPGHRVGAVQGAAAEEAEEMGTQAGRRGSLPTPPTRVWVSGRDRGSICQRGFWF